jgi:hypothetical protein
MSSCFGIRRTRSRYRVRNLVPYPLHGPFQVSLLPARMSPAHGSSHVDDVDGGFLVGHLEVEVEAKV